MLISVLLQRFIYILEDIIDIIIKIKFILESVIFFLSKYCKGKVEKDGVISQ